jgi:hypothetical protein
MTASDAPTESIPVIGKADGRPLVLGKPVRFRRLQQLIWVGMSVLLGAGLVAGLYWLGLQQDYRHLGLPFGSAKNWWDSGMGFIHSGRWADYRHGIRDGGEPAAWTMVGATLLGKARASARLLPLWLLPIAVVVLLAAIIAGTLGITWLTWFGPLSHVGDAFSWQQLVLGVILGRILHYSFAPVGATVRYHIVAHSALGSGGVPLWVREPLMPPAWRELWCKLRGRAETTNAKGGTLIRVLVIVGVIAFVFIAIVGNLAKYAVAHGLHIPVMNP